MVDATVSVRIRDMDRTRLFIHEVTALADEMRLGGSPYAERLEHALERYAGGGDDEGDGYITDGIETTTIEETYEPCPKCGYAGGDK